MAGKRTRKKAAVPAGPSVRGWAGPAWLGGAFGDQGWGRWLLLAFLLWLLLAILYPGPMFRAEVFASSDAGNADAFEQAGDVLLAQGEYPLWNPFLFAGMPSFGSLAYVKFLYPPTAVFNFLQNQLRFAPLTWLLGHLLLGGLGMAWLLSRWKLSLGYLVLGAVAWLLFPKIVAWGVHGHGSKVMAVAYLPWIVGWSLKIMDGGGRRAVGMTGLLLGLQIFCGHIQITYYTLLVTGWISLWNAVWPWEDELRAARAALRWKRLGAVVLGLALGFLVSGVMLLPIHEYAGISIRGQETAQGGGVGLDYATGWSLAPGELGTFILPASAGFGKATYLGHMPFTDYPNYFGLLLILMAASGWSRGRRRFTLALLTMSILALFVSFGNLGFGFYEWIYGWLPFFNKFRIPSMILIVVAFSLAILAARGAASWQEGTTSSLPPKVLPLLLGLAGLVFFLGGAASLMRGSYESGLTALAEAAGRQAPPVLVEEAWRLQRADLIRIGLILMTAGGALWFALRNEGFRGRGLVWVLVLLVAVDLMAVDRRIVHPEHSLHQIGRDSTGRARLVAAESMGRPYIRSGDRTGPDAAALSALVGHDRVWPLGPLGGRNSWMADGIRSLGGYHPAKLASFEPIRRRMFDEQPGGRLASWLAGSVVAFPGPFGEAEFNALSALGCDLDPDPLHRGSLWLYRNRNALPRARLLTSWQDVATLPEKDALEPFLDAIQSGTLDITRTVYLEQKPLPAPETAPGDLPVPEFVVDSLNEVVLKTRSPVPALLLLSDMMAPGWAVEVDGTEATLLVADLVLRAVALEAGSHTVRFHYHDPSVRAGLALTVTGLVLVALLLLSPLWPPGRFRQGAKTGDRAADEQD